MWSVLMYAFRGNARSSQQENKIENEIKEEKLREKNKQIGEQEFTPQLDANATTRRSF